MKYLPQVDQSHYFRRTYLSHDRWANYAYQVDAVLRSGAKEILEIGVGNRIISDVFKKIGLRLTTLDIDPELKPDVVGSVTRLPFPDASFDLVLAAEILEHLPWGDVSQALSEIARVTRRFAVITLPHSGYVFSAEWKIPLLPRMSFCFKIPHFWKRHLFNGEHYWELGKRSHPVSRVIAELKRAGFRVIDRSLDARDPAHYRFILEKR